MKACRVWYTLLSGTCWVSTFALSTFTPTCGTPKSAVVITPVSSGRLRAAGHERLSVLSQEVGAAAGPVFQNEGESSRSSYAENGGRRKRKRESGVDLGQSASQVHLDAVVAGFRSLAFVPRLERDEEKRAVGGLDSAQQAVSHHRADVLHARRVHDDFFDLLRRF